MKNPYEILGVRTNATEDEIKDAYRALVQKYHPDKYVNNPLADLASEKLQEINWAYDELFKNRGSYSASGQQGQYANFNQVRSLINDNRLGEAVNALNSMAVRNAEWHYLMGVIMQKRGWHDMAYQHFSVACKSDPYNEEYRSAKANMDMRRSTYTTQSYNEGYPQGGCSTCDFCQGLLCADCCCECMGGDLISCC